MIEFNGGTAWWHIEVDGDCDKAMRLLDVAPWAIKHRLTREEAEKAGLL